ncbi:MAG TPA: hypothetical protein VNG33_19595 [Polyangiaceae bacterium]|nr:hypothetical protein [Polyangiaceae bacterium]
MSRRVSPLFRLGGVVCLLAAHVGAQPADSVTRDAARTLGLAGVDAYQAGNYDAASDKLEKAYALMNVPSIGLWSARALAKRSLLVEAANRYFEVASLQVPQGDAAVQRQAQIDAQAELEQLRPQIPQLTVRISGADPSDVTLSIDGKAAPSSIIGKPRLINPGSHQVEAHNGSIQKSASVDTLLGKQASVVLDLSPAAHGAAPASAVTADASASPSSTRRTLGWIGVGAGGVGIALGSVMGGLAVSKRASLKSSGCTDTICPTKKQDDVDRLNTVRAVSTVGFIAGGVLASAGVVLLLTAPSSEHPITAVMSGETVTLTGSF